MSTPTLRWLQIHQYEQFEPVRIEFSSRENLILGLNGAGKTQLLKLIWAVSSLNLRGFAGKDLDVEFELETRSETHPRVDCTIGGRIEIKAESGAPGASSGVGAALQLRSGSQSFEVKLKDGKAVLSDLDGEMATAPQPPDGSIAPHNFNWNAEHFGARFDQFSLLLPRDGCCFLGESDREFQIFTDTLKFESRTTGRRRWLRFDPEESLKADMKLWRDLFAVVDRIHSASKTQEELMQGSEPESFGISLSALCHALGVQRLQLMPRLSLRSGEGRAEFRGFELCAQFAGAQIFDRDLTYGQRRALYAGLVSQARPDVPVACDEIDNGMHPRLVLALLEMWSERQVFVASHDKLVIDSTNFTGPTDVIEKIHIVRRRQDGRQGVKVFDHATATELHRNIEVGIQSPSDVLEAEGLW